MSHETALLKRKIVSDETHARLVNWGRWLRYDSGIAKLGYPQCPFVFSPRQGGMIADLDAEDVEFVVSSMYVGNLGNSRLYAFSLRVEYAEQSEQFLGPAADRAKDVSRRFRRPCALSTYYQHLAKAKDAFRMLAGPRK